MGILGSIIEAILSIGENTDRSDDDGSVFVRSKGEREKDERDLERVRETTRRQEQREEEEDKRRR